MSSVNWIVAILTGLFGGWIVFANWYGLIRWLVTKKSHSAIPFVGGILLAVCLYNTPIRRLWYIGLLIDPGFSILILSLVWYGFCSLTQHHKK